MAAPKKKVVKRKKVAIVGFTPTRREAPYDDEEFEIWALNALFKYPDVPRATRWFDLHPVDKIPEERLQAYATMGIPVYLQEKLPKIGTSIAFPADALREQFGTYWTNSISWMVGLALLEDFAEIHIYGVDMAQDSEYRFQRPNLEYFIGLARGAGKTVYIPPTADLLNATHEYGYETDRGLRRKLKERLDELNNRTKGLDQNMQKMQSERLVLDGARQNLSWMIQSLTVPDADSMTPDHPEIPDAGSVNG